MFKKNTVVLEHAKLSIYQTFVIIFKHIRMESIDSIWCAKILYLY